MVGRSKWFSHVFFAPLYLYWYPFLEENIDEMETLPLGLPDQDESMCDAGGRRQANKETHLHDFCYGPSLEPSEAYYFDPVSLTSW